MSPASSLRSHFIKHQKFFICATNLFSFHGGIHCLPPPSHLSTFAAAKAAQQQQQQQLRRFNIAALNFSTLPLSSGARDDSYDSPYLSVNLSCPRHLSVRMAAHFLLSHSEYHYVTVLFCFISSLLKSYVVGLMLGCFLRVAYLLWSWLYHH